MPSSGGQKSEIKVSAALVPSEPGGRMCFRLFSSTLCFVFKGMLLTLFFSYLHLFIYLWLPGCSWLHSRLSLAPAGGGSCLLQCSEHRLWSAGSVVVGHKLSCSPSRGVFPDQGLNPCSLHWQADSYPLHHQGSLLLGFWTAIFPPCVSL